MNIQWWSVFELLATNVARIRPLNGVTSHVLLKIWPWFKSFSTRVTLKRFFNSRRFKVRCYRSVVRWIASCGFCYDRVNSQCVEFRALYSFIGVSVQDMIFAVVVSCDNVRLLFQYKVFRIIVAVDVHLFCFHKRRFCVMLLRRGICLFLLVNENLLMVWGVLQWKL